MLGKLFNFWLKIKNSSKLLLLTVHWSHASYVDVRGWAVNPHLFMSHVLRLVPFSPVNTSFCQRNGCKMLPDIEACESVCLCVAPAVDTNDFCFFLFAPLNEYLCFLSGSRCTLGRYVFCCLKISLWCVSRSVHVRYYDERIFIFKNTTRCRDWRCVCENENFSLIQFMTWRMTDIVQTNGQWESANREKLSHAE